MKSNISQAYIKAVELVSFNKKVLLYCDILCNSLTAVNILVSTNRGFRKRNKQKISLYGGLILLLYHFL